MNLLSLNVIFVVVIGIIFAMILTSTRNGDKSVSGNMAKTSSTSVLKLSSKDLTKYQTIDTLPSLRVELSAPNAADLNWQVSEIFNRKSNYDGNRDKITYHLVPVGDKFLLVIPGVSGTQTRFSGEITPLEDRDKNPVQSVVASSGKSQPVLLPYVLNCLSKPSGLSSVQLNLSGSTLLLILLFALPIRNIVMVLIRGRNPLLHPIVKVLSKYGNPREVAKNIQAEMLVAKRTIGPAIITENWLIMPRTFTAMVIPLENLIWVYEMVRGPSPWTEVVLVPRELSSTIMGEYVFYAKRNEIKQLMDYIEDKRPWIIMGWTSVIKSDMMERRQDVIHYVDERREKYLAGKGNPIQHGAKDPKYHLF